MDFNQECSILGTNETGFGTTYSKNLCIYFFFLCADYTFGEKVAFIPYITAGDPDLSTTAEALKVLDSCGSDIIELGVPYSDPLADGPVIQV